MTTRRRRATAIPSASGVAPLALAATLLVGSPGRAEPPPREVPWNLPALVATPRMEETDHCPARGMKALFYEGADFKGRPTKVFAYYAAPDGQPPAGGWPAVVCAHGGGGTAYPDWVSAWNARGYAAIAMDLEGHLPNRREFGLEGPWPGGDDHHDAGPARRDWFGDRDLPDDEQWFYHAVADVIRANSLLRSFAEIDRDAIGLTGISWGGTIAAAVAGIDERFAFVIPVYGCGFIHESDNDGLAMWFPPRHMTDAQFRRYRTTWDPSAHLPYARMPILWVTGFDDPVFQADIVSKSASVAGGPSILCIRGRMLHGHGVGWQKKDIYAFADAVVKGGPAYPTLGPPELDRGTGIVSAATTGTIVGASLAFTRDAGRWLGRWWDNIPCEIAPGRVTARQPLPDGVTAYNINAKDDRGNLVSSPLVILPVR